MNLGDALADWHKRRKAFVAQSLGKFKKNNKNKQIKFSIDPRWEDEARDFFEKWRFEKQFDQSKIDERHFQDEFDKFNPIPHARDF